MDGEGDAMVDYVSVSNFCDDAKWDMFSVFGGMRTLSTGR